MTTTYYVYRVSNQSILENVVVLLRREGYSAWAEADRDAAILVTTAPTSTVGMVSGSGVWATKIGTIGE